MIRDQGKTDVKIRDLIEQFLDSGFEEEGETIVSVYEHILRLRTMMDFTEATNRRNDRLNAVYVENRVEQYIEHEITARMHSLFLGFIFSLPEFQQQIHGMISPNMFAHPLMALDTIQNAMHEANDRTNTVRNVNASYEERFAALGGVLSPRRDDQVDYCTYGQDEQRAMENLGDQIGRLSVKIDTARPGVMETPTRAEYHRCLRQNSYDSNGARSYNTATHSVETNQSFNSTAVSYEFGLGEPVTSKAASFAGNLETPKAPFYHGPVDEDDDTPKASKAFRPTAILQHKRNASSVENASPGKKVRMSKEIVPHKRNASKNASAGGSPKKALGYKEWSEMMGKAYGRGSHGTTTNDL